MSLVIATPSIRRRPSGGPSVRPRLAVVPPEAPVWSTTTVPASLRGVAEESEARLRARRAHPAGKGRGLRAVPSDNVLAFQARAPFDQEAEVAPEPVVEPIVAEPELRLTARGRAVLRVVVAVVLALVVAAAVLLVGRSALAGESASSLPVSYRVVLPGETLWEIAGKVAPGADRRDTVHRIQELNALSSAAVSAGQRIAVPVEARP